MIKYPMVNPKTNNIAFKNDSPASNMNMIIVIVIAFSMIKLF